MQTIEVAQKDWGNTLDEFSASHDGALISVDILGRTLGVLPQIRNLPLRGITAETTERDAAITISAARGDGEHMTHIIHRPTHVRLARTNDGNDVAVEIDSDGATAIIRVT